MKIHHNTLKRAAAHGIKLTVIMDADVEKFEASKNNLRLAVGTDPRDALDLAIKNDPTSQPAATKSKKKPTRTKKLRRETFEEGGEDDGEGDEGGDKSIIKPKYKEKYQPHRMTCGDDLAKRITDYATVEKRGELPVVSVDLLQKLALANGVWNPAWRSLRNKSGSVNVGMIRMNLGNRLRGLARKKQEIKWPS